MSDTVLDKLAGINPLLSNLIVGVQADQNFIAEQALPTITADAETVTYRKAANDGLVQEGDTQTLRSPGQLPREVDTTFDVGTATLKEYMLGASVDYRDEQAGNVNPQSAINVKLAKLSVAKSKVLLGKEQTVADLICTAGNYGSNTSSSIDFGSTGIRATVLAAKETIRKGCGYDPNTMVLGPLTLIELLENADVKDMIKYSSGGVTFLELIGQMFGVERVLVGSAVKQTIALPGAAGTGSYVWTGDIAALYYATRTNSPYNPSFGYLFQMPEFVAEWNNNPLVTNMAYGQRYAATLAFARAGYLWTNADGV